MTSEQSLFDRNTASQRRQWQRRYVPERDLESLAALNGHLNDENARLRDALKGVIRTAENALSGEPRP